MDGEVVNEVVIVEDEQGGAGQGGQLVEQRRQNGGQRRGLGRLQGCQQGLPKVGKLGLQGGDKVAEEAAGIVVASIKGKPTGGIGVAAGPLGNEGGFAKTGRCGHEDELAPDARIEFVEQGWAKNGRFANRRQRQLGLQKGGVGNRCHLLASTCRTSLQSKQKVQLLRRS